MFKFARYINNRFYVIILVIPKIQYHMKHIRITVELRYNEVPRDRNNYFVISGLRYKQNPDITKFPK